MNNLTVFETHYWCVSHRRDSRYPGNLIISTKSQASGISELEAESLAELGVVLAKTEILLLNYYGPCKVIFAKLGFSAGHGCHFHVIPASIPLLDEISAHPHYTNQPDGNDVLLFISREYSERELTKTESDRQLQTVAALKAHIEK